MCFGALLGSKLKPLPAGGQSHFFVPLADVLFGWEEALRAAHTECIDANKVVILLEDDPARVLRRFRAQSLAVPASFELSENGCVQQLLCVQHAYRSTRVSLASMPVHADSTL
jgi:hypothetical protein